MADVVDVAEHEWHGAEASQATAGTPCQFVSNNKKSFRILVNCGPVVIDCKTCNHKVMG